MISSFQEICWKACGYQHLSAGDLLREAETEISERHGQLAVPCRRLPLAATGGAEAARLQTRGAD